MILYHLFRFQKGAGVSIGRVIGRPSSTRPVRLGMIALGLIALWSLLYDGIVVRAHHHPVPVVAAADRQATPAALDAPCALCAAAAALEPFLPPTLLAWMTRIGAAIVTIAVAGAACAPRTHAHHWRSRAPPAPASPY